MNAKDKILIIFVMLLMCLTIPAYCQDNAGNHTMHTIEGTVTSLDWVGSMIGVNGVMLSASNANMHKGETQIGLSAVHVGDGVTATYYDEPSGSHKAVTIAIQCNGDCPV